MFSNPYIAVHRRQLRHRRRHRSLLATLGRAGIVLAGLGVGAVLVRLVFLDFLDGPAGLLGPGLSGVVLRLGLILVGLTAIDAYGAILRSEDRDVLALLPVDPTQVVTAATLRLLLRRSVLLPACGVLMGPVALESGLWPWFLALLGLASVQLFAWPAAVCTFLLAVHAAESPRWAPILDLLRGPNPRPQAAFLYAPGVVLLLSAGVLFAAMSAVAGGLELDPLSLSLLAVGPCLGLGAAAAIPWLSRRSWLRSTAVTTEIDARWEALRDRDDPGRGAVYLDWTVRFFPASWRRSLLHDLRHGWRGRRGWLSGAWIVGLAAAAAGWTEATTGLVRAVVVLGLGLGLVAGVVFAMERDEPPFLRWWLPSGPGPRHLPRIVVVALWAQPAVALAAAPVGLFGGWGALGLALALGEGYALALASLAVGTSRLGSAGPFLYALAAVIVVSGLPLSLGGLW